ncbi:MAG: HAD hydrolase family protein, partial [Terriglobales bacterium]
GAAEVLAIGDNYNDLGMLEFAGQAVLMGNAHAAMDRPGWARTVDNDHDGVAATIEALLEGR